MGNIKNINLDLVVFNMTEMKKKIPYVLHALVEKTCLDQP